MCNLEVIGKARCEKSTKSCSEIKAEQEDAQNLATISKSEMNSVLDQQKETERKTLLTQQAELSGLRNDINNFTGEMGKELNTVQTTVTIFVDHDLKKVCTSAFLGFPAFWFWRSPPGV